MDYSEARRVLDNMLKTIFRTVQTKCRRELEVVRRQFPSEDLTFPEETVVYTFRDAVKMLRESGWREEGEEEGNLHEIDDFSTRAEVRVGQLIKEKHGTDFYIVDKFPTAVRPFYTMPDFHDGTVSNSFDFFVRGEEILSGGQRVHQARDLEARMHSIGIEPDDMQEYVDTFRSVQGRALRKADADGSRSWGMPPHAGGGIGLERLVFLYLNLGNIRHASLFPRDPRSFPHNPPLHSTALPKANVRLKTLDKGVEGFDEPPCLSYDPMKLDRHPPLEDLIAKYGDSTSTAWTDAAYEVWRDEASGAAIGFVPGNGARRRSVP